MYPMTLLNAAVDYREHGEEMERRAGQPQAYVKPGDRTVCTYESAGTLTNRVEAAS